MDGNALIIVSCIIIAILILIFLTIKVKLHPFFALTIAAISFGLMIGANINDIMTNYATGLGGTIAGIGVVIAIGTVMGGLLEKSGAAETMAHTILKITGKKHASLGLAITGYFVSIPVFCDSAFVLLAPLAKRMSRDTGVSMTTMAVALAMGLHATHMLVPPTPGPLAVAGILGADLGMVIVLGMIVSIPVVLVAHFAGKILGEKYKFMPDELEEIVSPEAGHKRPGAFASFAPIILPIILMLLRTVASLNSKPFGDGLLYNIFFSLGNTVVALMIGLLIAFLSYMTVRPHDRTVWTFDGEFGEALKTAGQIVLIVGAGGAFATVLKMSDIQGIVTTYFSGVSLGILVPFAIGAIFRTAIGSGTVGMITAASMLLPLVDVLGFNTPIGLVIAMLACASGGFMIFHGNDDFFWVVTTTSGMKPEIAYRVFPFISVLQAFTSLLCVYILWLIFL
jgi:GntP family gluconate:H+ symporter